MILAIGTVFVKVAMLENLQAWAKRNKIMGAIQINVMINTFPQQSKQSNIVQSQRHVSENYQ
eukprot:5425389-Amphidinium_carterae.1